MDIVLIALAIALIIALALLVNSAFSGGRYYDPHPRLVRRNMKTIHISTALGVVLLVVVTVIFAIAAVDAFSV